MRVSRQRLKARTRVPSVRIPSAERYDLRSYGAESERRLEQIMGAIAALATQDYSRRIPLANDGSLWYGLAAGINLLIEGVSQQQAEKEEFHRRLVQTERLAAIGQLAAGVAHEVNNPASYVIANLGVVDD